MPHESNVVWSHGGHVNRFHPDWLYAHGGFDDGANDHPTPQPILWDNAVLSAPPTHGGPQALDGEAAVLAWLEDLRDYGSLVVPQAVYEALENDPNRYHIPSCRWLDTPWFPR